MLEAFILPPSIDDRHLNTNSIYANPTHHTHNIGDTAMWSLTAYFIVHLRWCAKSKKNGLNKFKCLKRRVSHLHFIFCEKRQRCKTYPKNIHYKENTKNTCSLAIAADKMSQLFQGENNFQNQISKSFNDDRMSSSSNKRRLRQDTFCSFASNKAMDWGASILVGKLNQRKWKLTYY